MPKYKTYSELQAEINALQAKAETARKAEIAGVVKQIREAIAHYGLTAADLGIRGGRAARSAGGVGKRKSAGPVSEPKYRDPKSGKTWTGRGKPPRWIAGVKNRDEFLINAGEASASSSTTAPAKPAVKAAKAVRKTATSTKTRSFKKAAAPQAAKRRGRGKAAAPAKAAPQAEAASTPA